MFRSSPSTSGCCPLRRAWTSTGTHFMLPVPPLQQAAQPETVAAQQLPAAARAPRQASRPPGVAPVFLEAMLPKQRLRTGQVTMRRVRWWDALRACPPATRSSWSWTMRWPPLQNWTARATAPTSTPAASGGCASPACAAAVITITALFV